MTDRPTPRAAVDATASRELDAARAAAQESSAAARRALEVDWVSRAARAYDGRVEEALGAVDAAVSLFDAAAGSARRAERDARDGEPPVCLLPGGR